MSQTESIQSIPEDPFMEIREGRQKWGHSHLGLTADWHSEIIDGKRPRVLDRAALEGMIG